MAIAVLDTYNTLPPVKAVRRVRRAYIGLLGMAFDRAAGGVDTLRAKGDDLLVDLTSRGEKVECLAKSVFSDVKAKAEDVAEDGIEAAKKVMPLKTLSGKAARIIELEAEIAATKAKLAVAKKPAAKKKAAAKTKTAPKAKAVKTVKAEVKVADVKFAAVKAEVIAETPAPVAPAVTAAEKVETADKYAAYYEKVAAYDPSADAGYIRAIVNHLGIALQSRDGQLVACSDAGERDTVRDSWLIKKLGVSGETETLDAKVRSVCDAMRADRMKDRVVFYYLLAKQEGKLAAL